MNLSQICVFFLENIVAGRTPDQMCFSLHWDRISAACLTANELVQTQPHKC